jgi:hypothetical protein
MDFGNWLFKSVERERESKSKISKKKLIYSFDKKVEIISSSPSTFDWRYNKRYRRYRRQLFQLETDKNATAKKR